MSLPSVAITGIGCLTAAGLTLNACMETFFRRQVRAAPPTGFSETATRVHPVFEIHEDFYRPEDYRLPHSFRTVQLVLAALTQALTEAGINRKTLRNCRTGVCIGTNAGGAVSRSAYPASSARKTSFLLPADRFLGGSPVVAVTREFDLSGPFQTIVNACSAGGDALGIGASWIRSGLCDVVIAGGADALYEITYSGFISLLNCDDAPCRPFDARRKGMNLGEGAGIMILESDDFLKQRGKTPRARLAGYGASSDAYHMTTPDPEAGGLRTAIREALNAAGLSPSDIAFINAHGTGTPDNDLVEARLFSQWFPDIPFLSTKGYTGHTLGGAGAVEAAFSISGLEKGSLPASGGYEMQDPELPASPIAEITPVSGRYALSQTLAFGGNNAVLILETGPNPAPRNDLNAQLEAGRTP